MPAAFTRRTATKVKDGRVRRKNRSRPTGHEGYVLDRRPPGHGFRHVVSKRDVQRFVELIPEWHRLSERLERIVLAAHDDCDGWHQFYWREETGAIYLCAWREDLWIELTSSYFDAHAHIFKRLGVSCDPPKDGAVMCRFTEEQARAYVLLHVFMHELGHHHDQVNQKHRSSTKGEVYAENFANSRFDQLWPEYVRVFGDPARMV
ncbi:MAG: hypothetical protein ACO1TE_15570 [Prosthecobacter sp.]